jgi:hypothetical protein
MTAGGETARKIRKWSSVPSKSGKPTGSSDEKVFKLKKP